MSQTLNSKLADSEIAISLQGRKALVTGGSRGIGKAIALTLAKAGANVAICGRNQHSLDATLKELSQYGRIYLANHCDVSQENNLCQLIAKTKDHFGSLDILINNAGQYNSQPVQGHNVKLWQEIVETNLTAAMIASREVLDEMISNRWGRIINISSVSGKAGEINGSAYSASKFGLIGLTQSLALEVAKHGITVNAVCPGWVATEMSAAQLSDKSWCDAISIDPSESAEIARLSVPQMRFIETWEVAQLVLYLCSNAAQGITGQAINICGGLSLH